MLIPIFVAEYKYNDNIIEINLKNKKIVFYANTYMNTIKII